MHNYIEFAKNYLKEMECEIIENDDNKNNLFIFKYNKIFFCFSLNEFFPYSLPSIITTKNFPDFPHFIEGINLTSLCLGYEEDFNLYESTPEEIIIETFERFFKLLQLSPLQQEKEFFKEFLHFWHKRTDINKKIKLYIIFKHQAEEIYIEETLIKDKNKRIGKATLRLAYTKENFINSNHFKSGTKIRGIYIPLINIATLSPFPENWNIRELLNYNISEESYNFLKNYTINKKYIWIIFSIKLENDFEIMFTAKFNFKILEKNNLLENLNKNLENIEPYYSKRYDVNYLCQRTSGNLNGIGKNISIIGCGSLGSYIAAEICKLGISKLNLFDSDILMSENLFRHILGANFLNLNKALGLKIYLESCYPQLSISSNNIHINYKNFFDYNFEESDLIIFSIGNSTTQLLINDVLSMKKFNKPVLYTWLDSLGSGCHALFVDYSKKGCYKCLSFNEDGSFSKDSKVTFSKFSTSALHSDGCGGTFTPYGNIILLKGASMILKIILDFFNGKSYDTNVLFSIKNYFQEDIEYTDRYFESSLEFLQSSDFIINRCDACGK